MGQRVLDPTNGLHGCKKSLYEGGVYVPGIIEWPAIKESQL